MGREDRTPSGPGQALVSGVLSFWFGEPGDADFDDKGQWWFEADADLDAEIGRKFMDAYRRAASGELDRLRETPDGCLALIILLDQFSRNLFRGSAEAFAADAKARELADYAISQGYDRDFSRNRKLFTYLPFEHSEDLADQERAVELIAALDDEHLTGYAVRHRDIIAEFGRFPHRNAVLGRESTAAELKLLEDPGNAFGQTADDDVK